tara:strand:- start:106 stop:435 length:330 start_codon:yes stop_codon:yes gene_type:complete
MRVAKVYFKNEEAGLLKQLDDGSFEFAYHNHWLKNGAFPAVSLTLPKTNKIYRSEFLFPFFYNMLPEGTNKQTVCFQMRIDESDNFGILLTTAKNDTIGAVRIEKIEAE